MFFIFDILCMPCSIPISLAATLRPPRNLFNKLDAGLEECLPDRGVQEGPGRRQGGQKAGGRPNTPTSLVVAALRSLESPVHRGFPHQASRQTRFDICLMHPSSSKASVCCQGPHRFCMLGRTLDRLLYLEFL